MYLKQEAEKHLSILKRNFERLREILPITAEDVEKLTSSDEGLKVMDQIAYRYIKLQDTLGKLIRSYLTEKGEEVEQLSTIDLVNILEKRGFPVSESLWLKMRTLRNILTHEYPETKEQIAQALNELYKLIDKVEKFLKELK